MKVRLVVLELSSWRGSIGGEHYYGKLECDSGRGQGIRPDMNVLLHAPPEVILERKEERSVDEIVAHQEKLQPIIDNGYARFVSLPIDTSVTSVDETRDRIVRGVIRLAHGQVD